mgnify:CR=1 FL=1
MVDCLSKEVEILGKRIVLRLLEDPFCIVEMI